jgi:hypothetical protein
MRTLHEDLQMFLRWTVIMGNTDISPTQRLLTLKNSDVIGTIREDKKTFLDGTYNSPATIFAAYKTAFTNWKCRGNNSAHARTVT